MKKIMVIGAGQMGRGITQVAALTGFSVVLYDHNEANITFTIDAIKKSLERNIEKGRLEAKDKFAILSRISQSTSLEDAVNVDLVIEAVVENISVKGQIFSQLDSICSANTILATNTSSLSITEMASYTKRPDKVIGMHFFNPVPAMKLVEVIRGLATSDETYRFVETISLEMGKTPVELKDSSGFVANRVVIPMINEAVSILNEGIATAEDIDQVLKLGMNYPMGPLALADLIGLDIVLSIMEVLYKEFGDKYCPCSLLRKYVNAGWLGRKSGRGFYLY